MIEPMTYSIKHDTPNGERRPADGIDCRPDKLDSRRSTEPADGSLTTSSPYTESATPPCLQWRESLRTLLDDTDGVQLFRRYLETERCEGYLEFWLACTGLKTTDRDACAAGKLIEIINRRYMKSHVASQAIRNDTRKRVEMNVAKAIDKADVHVFDDAHAQIEDFMNRNLYQNFLQSDAYLSYVGKCGEGVGVVGVGDEEGGCCGGVNRTVLETVEEDEVLEGVRRARVGVGVGKKKGLRRGEVFVGVNPSEMSVSSYAKYAPYVTPSVQDSEAQSLSSDAHTEDTVSLPDSSVDNYSVNSKKYLKTMRRYATHNRESSLPHDKFVPVTNRRNGMMNEPKAHADFAEFAALLIEKLEVVYKTQEDDNKIEMLLEEEQQKQPQQRSNFSGLIPELLKLSRPDGIDDQSILDEHVDRVWCDAPPDSQSAQPASQPPRFRDFASVSTDSGTVRDFPSPASRPTMPPPKSHHRPDAGVDSRSKEAARRTSLVNMNANEKYAVRSWINNNHTDLDFVRHRKCAPNVQSKSKKPTWQDHTPLQPLAQDPSMPMLPPPNVTVQLEEAKRRLEDDSQAKHMSRSKSGFPLKEKTHLDVQKARTLPIRSNILYDVSGGGDVATKRSSRRMLTSSTNSPTMFNTSENDVTAILYCMHGQTVPYLSKLAGKNVTLGQFKTLLPKKGKYRYFFKTVNTELQIGAVNVEIVDDNEILPLWDGKVCAQVHLME